MPAKCEDITKLKFQYLVCGVLGHTFSFWGQTFI